MQSRVRGKTFEIVPKTLAPVYERIRKKVARKLDRLRYLTEQPHVTAAEQVEVSRVLREIGVQTDNEVRKATAAYNVGLREGRYTIANFQSAFGHLPPEVKRTGEDAAEKREAVAACAASTIVHSMILSELGSKVGSMIMPAHITATVKIHGKTYALDPNYLHANSRAPTLKEYVSALVEAHRTPNSPLHKLARALVSHDSAMSRDFRQRITYFGGKDGGIAGAYNNWASTLAMSGRHEEALPLFETAARLHPEHFIVYANWGSTLSELGRYEEALKKLRIALSKTKSDASTHHNLGVVLYKMNKYEEAITHVRQAIKLQPNSIESRELLVKLLVRSGKFSQARAEERELRNRRNRN